MNNKFNIDRLLNPANKALAISGIVVEKKDGYEDVLKEYDGYIAGFGPTVIHVGIKIALAFYMKDNSKLRKAWDDHDKSYRARVVHAIAETLGYENGEALFNRVLGIEDTNMVELSRLTQEITDVSIALKIMIRTYNFVDNDN